VRASGSTRACARPNAWGPPASSRPAWRTRSATRSRPSSTPPRCSPTRRGSRRRALGDAHSPPHRGAAAQPHPLRFPALRASPGSAARARRHPRSGRARERADPRRPLARLPRGRAGGGRPGRPALRLRPRQIIQVLWNVALNGVEAMNGRGRLSLEVARQNGDVASRSATPGPGFPPRIFRAYSSRSTPASRTGAGSASPSPSASSARTAVASRSTPSPAADARDAAVPLEAA